MRRWLGCAAAAAVISLVGPIQAQSWEAWTVEGKLVGKFRDGQDKTAEDVSGIACAQTSGFPRDCVVVDDESQKAQFVTLRDGKLVAGRAVQLVDDKYGSKPVELDGEAVAYHDGYFYVVGSHGRKRHETGSSPEEIAARHRVASRIFRIKLDQVGLPAPSFVLKDLITKNPKLSAILDRPLNEDGITIEGAAVHNGRFYVGFRGPSSGGAAVLSFDVGALFDGKADDGEFEQLELGDRQGIRDLAVSGDEILILAGPTVGEGGPYAIHAWGGRGKAIKRVAKLPDVAKGKAEALLPLDRDASGLRVLVLFDGPDNGAPAVVRIAAQ